jgi:hypothetical protein
MTIRYLQKCDEVYQQRIAGVLLVLFGVISFGTIMFVVLNF